MTKFRGFVGAFVVGAHLLLAITTSHAQMDPALQIALGNPCRPPIERDYRQLLLIERPQYAVVYDNVLHCPEWVAWHLAKQDMGDVGRGQFMPDSLLKFAGYVIVPPSAYTSSGYDRGHNCPSADRTATRAANDSVFLMTNVTPQTRELNVGPWKKLEDYCRRLALAGNDLFIYCGHGFTRSPHHTIGLYKVAVPDFAWKIVVVVPPGEGDPVKRITAATRVIAVRIPNIDNVGPDWEEYQVSVRDIEKATNLVFFDSLPKTIAAALKDSTNAGQPAPPLRNYLPDAY